MIFDVMDIETDLFVVVLLLEKENISKRDDISWSLIVVGATMNKDWYESDRSISCDEIARRCIQVCMYLLENKYRYDLLQESHCGCNPSRGWDDQVS